MTLVVTLGWVSLEQFGAFWSAAAPFLRSQTPLIRHILGQVPQYLSEYSALFSSSFVSIPVLKICLVHWGSIQECFLQNLGNFNIIEINMLRHPFVLGTHLSLHFTPNTRWKAWSTGQARWIRVATRRHKWDFIGCLCRHQQVLFCSCHTAFLGTILFMAQYSFWHNAIDTMLLAQCFSCHTALLGSSHNAHSSSLTFWAAPDSSTPTLGHWLRIGL